MTITMTITHDNKKVELRLPIVRALNGVDTDRIARILFSFEQLINAGTTARAHMSLEADLEQAMDPDANLKEQEDILRRSNRNAPGDRHIIQVEDRDRLRALRFALTTWLDGGGAEPNWAACSRASCYYGR